MKNKANKNPIPLQGNETKEELIALLLKAKALNLGNEVEKKFLAKRSRTSLLTNVKLFNLDILMKGPGESNNSKNPSHQAVHYNNQFFEWVVRTAHYAGIPTADGSLVQATAKDLQKGLDYLMRRMYKYINDFAYGYLSPIDFPKAKIFFKSVILPDLIQIYNEDKNRNIADQATEPIQAEQTLSQEQEDKAAIQQSDPHPGQAETEGAVPVLEEEVLPDNEETETATKKAETPTPPRSRFATDNHPELIELESSKLFKILNKEEKLDLSEKDGIIFLEPQEKAIKKKSKEQALKDFLKRDRKDNPFMVIHHNAERQEMVVTNRHAVITIPANITGETKTEVVEETMNLNTVFPAYRSIIPKPRFHSKTVNLSHFKNLLEAATQINTKTEGTILLAIPVNNELTFYNPSLLLASLMPLLETGTSAITLSFGRRMTPIIISCKQDKRKTALVMPVYKETDQEDVFAIFSIPIERSKRLRRAIQKRINPKLSEATKEKTLQLYLNKKPKTRNTWLAQTLDNTLKPKINIRNSKRAVTTI